jgi:proline iminopeptidase
MMFNQTFHLFPEIEPYHSGWLEVSKIHHIYFEQCGNPNGQPIVFLHGGPGSGCNAAQRRFFDPEHYRIVLFDQRGCGRSTPQGCIEENTTDHLVADIDRLREFLNIGCWQVFGGSWGSTLALAYALAHPSRVTRLNLRGIFLSRKTELDWFLNDVKQFHPDAWEKLLSILSSTERNDLINAYIERIFSEDPAINIPAAINWNAYETSIMTLLPDSAKKSVAEDSVQLARARVQLHYLVHECFMGQRDILDEVKALAHIPTTIIQGRYDMVCPPLTAWQLKQAMPHARFHMVADAGHSAMEAGTRSALIAVTEQFKLT